MSFTAWAAAVVSGVGCAILVTASGCSSSGAIETRPGADGGRDSPGAACTPGNPGCQSDSGSADSGTGDAGDVEAAPTGCTFDTDCPSTGTSCATSACSASACVTTKAPLGTPCSDHAGIVCDGHGTCVDAHCSDGAMDSDETGTDCGGATCGKCAPGATCKTNGDCTTGDCNGGTCVTCGTATSTLTCCPDGSGVTLIDTLAVCAPEGMQWLSCDRRFGLIMQTDGNLVLYDGPCVNGHCGTPLWASNTVSCGGCVTMQGDGNLVVYGAAGQVAGDACWASGTNGHPGAYLQLQNDGDLVMYSSPGDAGVGPDGGPVSVWSSNTCCH
jgi:hypothetical protein